MPRSLLYVDPKELAKHPDVLAWCYPIAREVYRRRTHPFWQYKPDHDLKRDQLAFHQSKKAVRLVFGGNQSGKSRAIAQELAWWMTESHPYQETPKAPRIYVISATYRTIQEGIYRHLNSILPEWLMDREGSIVPGWNLPCYIKMKNGSQVDFISGEGREEARRKLAATTLDLAIIDEEVDSLIWSELQARRLARQGKVIVGATLVRSEPWCLELEDQAEMGSETVALFRFSTYRARDCGHVSASVVAEIEATNTEEDRLVRLEGKSRKYEGLVYPGFSGAKHVVQPFDIPANWTRYCALDPGWRTFAVLWVAVSPEGKYVIYREHYATAKHYSQIADSIHAAEGYKAHGKTPEGQTLWAEDSKTEKIALRYIDPSAYGFHETGELRVGSLLSQDPYNLYCAPARNDVEAGIEMCARSLLEGIDGIPKMRVFSTCKNFLKEIRTYRRAKDSSSSNQNEKRDAPLKRNDHLLDCWRYLELGGLTFIQEEDPRFRLPTEEELKFPFGAGVPLAELHKQQWRELMAERHGTGKPPPHVGGIGTEY